MPIAIENAIDHKKTLLPCKHLRSPAADELTQLMSGSHTFRGQEYIFTSLKNTGTNAGFFLRKAVTGSTRDAMIKLSKRREDDTIKEMVAMLLARELGYNAANCKIISLQDTSDKIKPALFSIFDTMEPLTEHVAGNNPNRNHAVLKPIGEGLVANTFIEDLGKYLPFFYWLSDPDAVGKDAQNKGIMGNQLFIFDTLVVSQRLGISEDFSATNLSCFWRDLKHWHLFDVSRHHAFRNYSVFQDAAYVNILEGLQKINDFWKDENGKEQLQQLESDLRGKATLPYTRLADAVNHMITHLDKRLKDMRAVLSDRLELLKETEGPKLVAALDAFEKLISPTTAYSEEGVPLRSLQFLAQNKRVCCSASIVGDRVHITTKGHFPPDITTQLETLGIQHAIINYYPHSG